MAFIGAGCPGELALGERLVRMHEQPPGDAGALRGEGRRRTPAALVPVRFAFDQDAESWCDDARIAGQIHPRDAVLRATLAADITHERDDHEGHGLLANMSGPLEPFGMAADPHDCGMDRRCGCDALPLHDEDE